ncbi:MAG: DMT family transporter [Burkholderiaceae bacterium]
MSAASNPHHGLRDDRRGLGYGLLFAGMALVGSYVALSKPLTAAIPVFLLAWLRFAIAVPAMLPWLRRVPGEPPLDKARLGTLFLQSLFGNFLFSICMLYGVSLTSASAAGLILSFMPAAVALLSWAVLRERMNARTWLAVALAVAGVAVLTLGRRHDAGSASLLGNLLVLASVFCEATYVILGKRLTMTVSPRRISAIINLFGLVLMTPLAAVQALSFDFSSLGPSLWVLLIFYSLSASMFSTWLWLSGQRYVPASQSGVFTIAMPLAATTVGVLFLGEHFGWPHGLAFVLAAAGIALITTTAGRAPARPAP